jgi:hypothetical protein
MITSRIHNLHSYLGLGGQILGHPNPSQSPIGNHLNRYETLQVLMDGRWIPAVPLVFSVLQVSRVHELSRKPLFPRVYLPGGVHILKG